MNSRFFTLEPHTEHTTSHKTANGHSTYSAIEAMVIAREKAATEEAPTTVLTSSTTLPIVLESAEEHTSICEHMLVGERAGTASKGQTESGGICRVQ